MRTAERWLLPVLGLTGFVAAWQVGVYATRPALVQQTTLALSTVQGDSMCAAIVDHHGAVVAQQVLRLLPRDEESSTGTLRLWLGSMQPSLLALPPGTSDESAVVRIVRAAQAGFGGGLDARPVAVPAAASACDEAAARAVALQGATARRPAWLPGPVEAFQALAAMTASGEMLRHIIASLFRVASGFTIAVLVGVPFGIALGSFARLSALTNSVIQGLRPISPIAWLPVATLALGGGDVAAIFLIFLAGIFPIAVSTAAAVASLDERYRRSALNFGVRGLAFARHVVFPAALPAILTALRIALGISWVVVVAAEMLGVESGLGFLVLDARNQLRYDRVVAAMIVIGLIGLSLDAAVRRLQTRELEHRGMVQR